MINFILLQTVSDLGKSTTEEVVNGVRGLDKWEDMGMEYLPKVLAALLIGFIGYWLIKWVTRLFLSLLQKRHIDQSFCHKNQFDCPVGADHYQYSGR